MCAKIVTVILHIKYLQGWELTFVNRRTYFEDSVSTGSQTFSIRRWLQHPPTQSFTSGVTVDGDHFFVWFLPLMRHLDFPSRHVHLCRLIVGHTHNGDIPCLHRSLNGIILIFRWPEDVHHSELIQFFETDRSYDFKEFLMDMWHDRCLDVRSLTTKVRRQHLVQNQTQTKNGS